jgi:hypothetical protein
VWFPELVLIPNLAIDSMRVGTKHGFMSFGPGIHIPRAPPVIPFSLSPFFNGSVTPVTEADDYQHRLNFQVQSRAILLNTVVYGNAQMLYCTDTSAGSRKSGFHSVSTSELCRSTRARWVYVLALYRL